MAAEYAPDADGYELLVSELAARCARHVEARGRAISTMARLLNQSVRHSTLELASATSLACSAHHRALEVAVSLPAVIPSACAAVLTSSCNLAPLFLSLSVLASE